jgi:hypothetical protein
VDFLIHVLSFIFQVHFNSFTFYLESLKETYNFGDVGIDRMIILKWILNVNRLLRYRLGSSGWR